MSDILRRLNKSGSEQFRQYVHLLRTDGSLPVPVNLLLDPGTSEDLPFNVQIDSRPSGAPFSSAYELGAYLCQNVFNGINKANISRDSGMWNWIALYLFDELCPATNGQRSPLETPAYVMPEDFNFQRYYRHLVRNPWVLVSVHGQISKVCLTAGDKHTNPMAVRNEIVMQLGATQEYVESSSVMATAYSLYYDAIADRHKAGASSKKEGGPRRLVAILGQFDLTYDLHASPADTLIGLLPKEFDRFRGKQKATLKKSSKSGGTAAVKNSSQQQPAAPL